MLISLSGLKGSGKGTVSKILQEKYGFVEYSFSTALKDIISTLFSWDRELLEGNTNESRDWREQEDEYWSSKLGYKVTPRVIMTKIGTDLFRNNFNQDFWIYVIERKILDVIHNNNVVIERVSYLNECEFVKRLDGITVWVYREYQKWQNLATELYFTKNEIIRDNLIRMFREMNIHDSEYSLCGYNFDYVIDNVSNLETLEKKVDILIKDYNCL